MMQMEDFLPLGKKSGSSRGSFRASQDNPLPSQVIEVHTLVKGLEREVQQVRAPGERLRDP